MSKIASYKLIGRADLARCVWNIQASGVEKVLSWPYVAGGLSISVEMVGRRLSSTFLGIFF